MNYWIGMLILYTYLNAWIGVWLYQYKVTFRRWHFIFFPVAVGVAVLCSGSVLFYRKLSSWLSQPLRKSK